MVDIRIDRDRGEPIYRQIVERVRQYGAGAELHRGEMLPSMNALAAEHGISRETVKKAYSILVERGIVEPRHGLGFFLTGRSERDGRNILVLFDKLSAYKQIMLNAMGGRLGDGAQVTIRLHNQSVDLLKYYLDEELDKYDYYIVAPHFPLDRRTESEVMHELRRIPNRKLIVVDRETPALEGNYGAVFQDFATDICDGLGQGLEHLRSFRRIEVITTPSSLYHEAITDAVRRFCLLNGMTVHFHTEVSDEMACPGSVYLLLNSQLDSGLMDLVGAIRRKGLRIGTDVGIISYNDSPINELVLGGLTTVSADFAAMGTMAADMILDRSMRKLRCPFRMTRRFTF